MAAQAVCVTTHKGSWVKLLMCLISIVTRSWTHLVREMYQSLGSKSLNVFWKTLRKRAIWRIFKLGIKRKFYHIHLWKRLFPSAKITLQITHSDWSNLVTLTSWSLPSGVVTDPQWRHILLIFTVSRRAHRLTTEPMQSSHLLHLCS